MNKLKVYSALVCAIALLGAAMSLDARHGGGGRGGGHWGGRGGGWGGRGWGGGWGGRGYGYGGWGWGWPGYYGGYYGYGYPYRSYYGGYCDTCSYASPHTVVVRKTAADKGSAVPAGQVTKLERQIDNLAKKLEAQHELLNSLKEHLKQTRSDKRTKKLQKSIGDVKQRIQETKAQVAAVA